ncbi:MAG: DNA helicase RecQ [Acutalibacteraceae bacterium]
MRNLDKYGILKEYFGYDGFREGQEQIIDSILGGRDVLAVMPTGAGKSLCFQIPAIMLDGTAIVISPLISLMKDQIYSLKENGIPAAAINSSSDREALQKTYSEAYDGKYKLIYISPERLDSRTFLALASSIKISFVCVDEAHCVSQWGQDFRSSYLKISNFISSFNERPTVAAFTATATQAVRCDIENLLGLKNPDTVVTGFDRKNLYFEVRKPKSKLEFIKEYLDMNRDKSGIIYCSTRKNVELLYGRLSADGYSVTKYHAGLDAEERKSNQDNFVRDNIRIIIATNAFGMGIDKSNISFVIHYNMPGDIESYYQEAGRAGRDGENAECILLYSGRDTAVQRYFINHPSENDELSVDDMERLRRRKLDRLDKMVEYCMGRKCLRNYILSYFGEVRTNGCGNCSVCCGVRETADITVQAQKILCAVARTKETLTVGTIVDFLSGSETLSAARRDLSQIKTFGALKDCTEERIAEIILYLVRKDLIDTDSGILKLNENSRSVLFSGKRVYIPYKSETKEAPPASKADDDLLRILKKLRKEIADRRNVPAFVIFSDSTLREISAVKPLNAAQFLRIKGVGAKKAESYGQIFIKAVNLYINEKNVTE